MRLNIASLISVVGLAALVQAGKEVRGAELLMFFEAYRMDVDIKGVDGATLAKGCKPLEADFEDGKIPAGQKGCNLWGFMRTVGEPSFNPSLDIKDPNDPDQKNAKQVKGWSLVTDPMSPTVEEVRNMYRWGSNPYSRIQPKEMFPDKFGTVRGEGKDTNAYFDFHNMQALLGKRIDTLSAENMEKAKPHLEKINVCLQWAGEGRRKDQAPFKIKAAKDVLKSFKANVDAFTSKKKKSTISESHFGEWEEINTKETAKKIRKTKLDKDLEPAREAIRNLSKNFRNGLLNYHVGGRPIGGNGSAKDHGNTADASAKLMEAVQKRLGGDACEWPEPKE
ncbi:uncharacterized protein DNG_03193 [Cephalotrichum gorgonifer]|uniref:Uncharacterized protein n=1 Tax=Cephalotrichum gorgonifer TaxID=2041049 RepID=A0AAE8STC2_9PEZI|nr:uncharacterized protein DNG_03193 [Cephalotrichum gorgonifer]